MAGRVLVVDDEPSVRGLVKDTLRLGGFEVEAASDGVAALAVLRGGEFGLVVTDALMPGMNGLELLRRIREIRPALPVVVLTAGSGGLDVSDFLAAGAADYLVKPFQIDDLLAVVRRWVGQPDVSTGSEGRTGHEPGGGSARAM